MTAPDAGRELWREAIAKAAKTTRNGRGTRPSALQAGRTLGVRRQSGRPDPRRTAVPAATTQKGSAMQNQGIVTREDDVLEATENGEWDRVPDLLAAMYPHERRQLAAAIEDKTFEGMEQLADLAYWQTERLMRLLDDARDGRP